MSVECRGKTMTCQEARRLAERQVAGEPGDGCEAEDLHGHLEACEACRAHLEQLLAARVLRETETPRPPEDLADSISSAALTYIRYQNRPMHQKALGSPAFFATCASLLCGAVICLLASMRVAAVPAEQEQVTAPAALAAHQAPGSWDASAAALGWEMAVAVFTRATERLGSFLAGLPGGERPPSLVALYPRGPVLVSLRSTGPARLRPAPIGHSRPDRDE